MRADRRNPPATLRPRAQNLLDGREHRRKILGFLPQQGVDVRAWSIPCTALSGDLLDLGERQSEPTRLGDESERTQYFDGVDAITRCRPPRARHDAACFIQAERLAC